MTVTVLTRMVPAAIEVPTFATNVNVALPTAKDGLLQDTVAPVVQVQPGPDDNDTKVVAGCKVPLQNADGAGFGPLLVTVMV